MIKVLFLSTLALLCQYSYGQDTITLKNHKIMDVKILEKTGRMVRYKMSDYEDGPVLYLKTNRIKEIEYKNGYTDLMGFENPRKNRPLCISAGYAHDLAGGGALFSTSLDYFVIPQVELEMNLGTSDLSGGLYYSAGSRFHFNSASSEHKLTPFTGVLAGSYYGDGFVQVPAGINYLTGIGVNASLSVNELVSFNSWQATFIELRLGWRFTLLR